MSHCLCQQATAPPPAVRPCGQWRGCRDSAEATRRAARERWHRLLRFAVYAVLVLLPGGGLFLLFRWLYLRFNHGN